MAKKQNHKAVRAVRISSRKLNAGKLEMFKILDKEALRLKEEMSKFIRQNLNKVFLNDKDFRDKSYKLFKSELHSSWVVQTLFSEVYNHYAVMLDIKLSNKNYFAYKDGEVTHYKRNYKQFKQGDVKATKQIRYKTDIMIAVEYLIQVQGRKGVDPDLNNVVNYCKNKKVLEIIKRYQEKGLWDRVKRCVELARENVLKSCKMVEYTTGTHIVAYTENGRTVVNSVTEDETNSLNKDWFKYHYRGGDIWIPLQKNDKYHDRMEVACSYHVKVHNNRVDIITHREVELFFQDYKKAIGVDLNAKHNLFAISDGTFIDYDRGALKELTLFYRKLEKKGIKSATEKQLKRLEKLVAHNQALLQLKIRELVDHLVDNDITDVVIEDLDSFPATFGLNEEFGVKYSKLTRLLRLGTVKKWLTGQAEKRGIRVHITNPAYSSQECPKCHNVTDRNRLVQEKFKCNPAEGKSCGYEANADTTAGLNLLNRLMNVSLRKELHTFDEHGRMLPKKIKRENIKEILLTYRIHQCVDEKISKKPNCEIWRGELPLFDKPMVLIDA